MKGRQHHHQHSQNADYSRQWQEYWKQMSDQNSHHQQYSAHGQVNNSFRINLIPV